MKRVSEWNQGLVERPVNSSTATEALYSEWRGISHLLPPPPSPRGDLHFCLLFKWKFWGRMATVGWWVVLETTGGGWVDRREVR
jgi:hypothetical protein